MNALFTAIAITFGIMAFGIILNEVIHKVENAKRNKEDKPVGDHEDNIKEVYDNEQTDEEDTI